MAARRALGAVVALGAAYGLGELLFSISRHVASGNSDGATVVLEGQAMNGGHVLLSGWSLSLDSFWSVDVPFYAGAVRLFGFSSTLLNLVPSIIAVIVVLVAGYLATNGKRSKLVLPGVVATGAVLALPSRAMSLFFLQGPLHVATILWCLLAFLALQRDRFGWRWAVAVILLAAGLLGDLQTLLLGLVPVLITGLFAAHLARNFRAAVPTLTAPFAAGALALVVREVAKAFGSFKVPRANTYASFHQLLHNVAHAPGFFVALLGVDQGPFPSTGVPLPLQLLRVLGLALVLGGPLLVGVRLVRDFRRALRGPVPLSDSTRMDCLLFCLFLAGLATFVVLPITDSDGYARYLLPSVIAGAILGGRVLTGFLQSSPRAALAPLALGAALLLGVFAAGFGDELKGTSPGRPAATLSAFLLAHHLHHGVGDYWSSSIITVASKGEVAVRPVIAGTPGHLVRYEKQSSAAWYGAKEPFNFLVFNAGAIWNGVDAAATVATFGHPKHVYAVGTYRIYVWATPHTVSVLGSTGP